MRLASFNLENLFTRPEVMNRASWAEGAPILADVQELNTLISKPNYSVADKAAIKKLLDKYQFGNPNKKNRPFKIEEVREHLYKAKGGTVQIVANGRDAWTGWVELTRTDIDPVATSFTGKVIEALSADVQCTIEVEDRLALARFNEQILGDLFDAPYPADMCVDGNDDRGIDVGILSKFPIVSVRSHIFDKDAKGEIFSRDCAEYEVLLPSGKTLWILVNHFKSKIGTPKTSNAKRHRQATRAAEIYREARTRSDFVAVVGDLNDTPESAPLDPLINKTDLRDISAHVLWQGAKGTYGTGNAKNSKIDYILLSPALWQLVTAVGIERRGIYAPSLKIMWPGVTSTTAASDHAAIWVDLNV